MNREIISAIALAALTGPSVLQGQSKPAASPSSVRGEVNILDFGAVPDDGKDDTSAFAAAVSALPANGGTVIIPAGTYLLGNFTVPPAPKIVNFRGVGVTSTILQASAPNVPIFKSPAPAAMESNVFSGFSMKAHPQGSSGEAVNLRRARSTAWRDIEFLSNGKGNFAKGFLLVVCYGNILDHIRVQGQSGPGVVVSCENDGSAASNPNLNMFRDFWIFSNTSGMTTAIDAADSTMTTIETSLFEHNLDTKAVIPGQLTVIRGCWFENEAQSIAPAEGRSMTPNSLSVDSNYFSGIKGNTVVVPPTVKQWHFKNNPGALNLDDKGHKSLVEP